MQTREKVLITNLVPLTDANFAFDQWRRIRSGDFGLSGTQELLLLPLSQEDWTSRKLKNLQEAKYSTILGKEDEWSVENKSIAFLQFSRGFLSNNWIKIWPKGGETQSRISIRSV